ncbi:class I SAM-dependent methyltransferase [Brevibacillus humidisoli]|uniref:class I SAM-dependent methyltransferase n=1 Tax=Brevibacillus humidisoli TaxID=2895522 RepID=UPI001E4ED26D|nr:class I SAM-dependent methyltransferase [Brevibacillus humidisoli]UFJ40808.1 class I SAM-dependent methyltransferase [Brevibacillus humidisoli]
MFTSTDFFHIIDHQLLFNQNKSLFYTLPDGKLAVKPSEKTVQLFKHKPKEIVGFIESTKREGTISQVLEAVSQRVLRLFLRANQFLDFQHRDRLVLQSLYKHLLQRICTMGSKTATLSDAEIDELFDGHYKRLQAFLVGSNGTAIFSKYREHPELFAVPCAEYDPQFQLDLLGIGLDTIKQPVLDIGCGAQANLVRFLRESGIEAYGIDRDVEECDYLFRANWFDWQVRAVTWGTVISHMAFSNHFMHHHLRSSSSAERYAKTYMQILQSLQAGGSFIYAPGLPFLEDLLRSHPSYTVNVKEIKIDRCCAEPSSRLGRPSVTNITRQA